MQWTEIESVAREISRLAERVSLRHTSKRHLEDWACADLADREQALQAAEDARAALNVCMSLSDSSSQYAGDVAVAAWLIAIAAVHKDSPFSDVPGDAAKQSITKIAASSYDY